MEHEHTHALLRTRNAWTKADSAALMGFAATISGWLLILVILFAR